MRRLTIGPFNRVEGDLEVKLDVEDGVVTAAHVVAPLFRGFEQILEGRPALDALTLAPRICGICSVSQSMAAAAALRATQGLVAAENGVLAANIAHAAENAADHLTHFYIFFMPDFARASYRERTWYEPITDRFKAMTGACAAEVLPARARLLETMGILAGKWPHSLAFQPGGTTRAIDLGDRVQLLTIIAEFRSFLERVVFGETLDRVLAITSVDELDRWREGRSGDFARFLALADDLALDQLGLGPGPLMSYGAYHSVRAPFFAAGILDTPTESVIPLAVEDITEDVSHAWMGGGPRVPARGETRPDPEKPEGYTWAKAPRWAGRPVEVGAVARQTIDRQALIRDLVCRSGANVKTRVVARLIETARLAMAMEAWAREIRLREPFCHRLPRHADGVGVGLVEAARGSLGHWIELSGGRIQRYQIIAPTTWNFSPRDAAGTPGPLEQALVGTPIGSDGPASVAVQHIVRSFDPCMVCTAH